MIYPKSKKIAIAVFSTLILFILSILIFSSGVQLFSTQHPEIALLGIFLGFFSIPVIFYILLKKEIKLYTIIFYLVYFTFTGFVNIFLSIVIPEGMEILDFDGDGKLIHIEPIHEWRP